MHQSSRQTQASGNDRHQPRPRTWSATGPKRKRQIATVSARFVRGELNLKSQDSGLHAFGSFADELVHHVVEVAGLPERGELTVSAGAFVQDAVGIGDLLAAAQLVQHVIQEPLDQLADEVARRELLPLAEVDELAVEAEADGTPLVLFDQLGGVYTKRHVVAPQLPELGDEGLQDRGHADCLVHARADVANAELQRGKIPVRAQVPPELGAIRYAVRVHEQLDQPRKVGP